MPASDEFPRGITINASVGSGVNFQVTFPACPGIAWVITDIDISAYEAAANSGVGSVISTTLGASGPEGLVSLPSNAVVGQSAEWSWHGECAGEVGQALSVNALNVVGVEMFGSATAKAI